MKDNLKYKHLLYVTSSFIIVALLNDCKAVVILRPKSAKTILYTIYVAQFKN